MSEITVSPLRPRRGGGGDRRGDPGAPSPVADDGGGDTGVRARVRGTRGRAARGRGVQLHRRPPPRPPALDVGPGDEVLVPSLTFVASANAVRYCGATPVFVDIVSENDLTMDVADAAAKRTARTRAVMAVHHSGYAADLTALRTFCEENGLKFRGGCRSVDRRVARRHLVRYGGRCRVLQLLLHEERHHRRGRHGHDPPIPHWPNDCVSSEATA